MADPQDIERLPFFGVVPSGWSCRRVEHLADYRSLSVNSDQLQDGPVLLYSIPVLQETGQPEWVLADDIGSEKIPLTGGEILVSRLNPRKGLVVQVPPSSSGRMLASSEFVPLRPVRTNERYLYYVVASESFTRLLDSAVESVTRSHKRVRPSQILKARIPVPSEVEQKRLTRFLDRETAHIDRLIEKKERLISLLEEKRSALITHSVTKGLDPDVPMKDSRVEWIGDIPEHWQVATIGRLADVKRGASPRPISDPRFFAEGGARGWVRIRDVTRCGKYLTSTEQKLSADGIARSVPVPEGELLLSIAATVGLPTITAMDCCIHDGFVWLRDLQCDREFLYYVLTMDDPFVNVGKLGTQENVNSDIVGRLTVPVPPRSEQKGIAEWIHRSTSQINDLIGATQRSVSLLRERRSALITAAVTGQIDPVTYEGWADATDPDFSVEDIDLELESRHA